MQNRASSPETMLLLSVLAQAFRDYWVYRWQKKPKSAVRAGKDTEKWIISGDGTFPIIASAAGKSVEELRMLCLYRMMDIDKGIRPDILQQNRT